MVKRVRPVLMTAADGRQREQSPLPGTHVVADGGYPLRWIAHHEVFTFWKHEVQPHLYDEARPYLADYPNEYFYWPSEWRSHSGETIILLERAH